MKALTAAKTFLPVAAIAAAAFLLSGCNARKKNTAAARQYTAFITRYNIHYNGDKHYTETLHEMEGGYEDEFSQLLFVHPAEARAHEKAPQPSGNFDRSIEKAQKAIQLRSITKKPQKKAGKASDPAYKAWMKRDEYNPFLHNSWMMMGRSQYMNGDFPGASATFFYISRHFSWLPTTVTEAKLWQARSYLAMDWLFEAEQILTRIKADQLTDGTLQHLYDLDFAELYIKNRDFAKAAPFLERAARHGSAAQKTRLNFLLGQVYARTGDRAAAYKAYGRAAGSNSAAYRTKFNARIKQSEVYQGSDIAPEVKALRRMTRLDRNKDYLDQIYYAIGNLYLSRRDTAKAIENYVLAAEKSTRNGIDKAISQVTLGNLYYDRRKYELAQPCYAEAVPRLPENYPGIDTLRRRSDVLDELATYSQNVTLQDSLLRLAAMDSVQRLAVIDRLIADLKKKEKEDAEAARREAYMATRDNAAPGLNSNAKDPASFVMNTDGAWYFYNPSARTAGRTEFQRRWGSRKLEDNWRRRNKSVFSAGDFDTAADENAAAADSTGAAAGEDNAQLSPVEREKQMRADDPHYREYYLKQIPFTPEEKAVANDVIQESLYNMGTILKDKLEDFGAATAQYDRLLTGYPDNIYRLDVYYNLYLIFVRLHDTRLAERYRAMILTDFADSKYGIALRNPAYIDNLRRMDAEQQSLYEQAFDAYMDGNNARVQAIYADVAERYPMSKLMPRFMFLDALTLAADNRPDQFNAMLRQMLEQYPQTDIAPVASAWLKGMAQGRTPGQGATAGNMRGMLWNISLSADSTAADGRPALEFALDDNDRQLLVFVYDTRQVSTNRLLYEIARHNFASFVVKDFDIEAMNFGQLGLVIVKGFDNMDQLNHYRAVMARSRTFTLPAGVRPVAISVPDFESLLKGGGSLDDYFRVRQERNYIDAQADLLPYSQIETLDEADARAAQNNGNPAQGQNDSGQKTGAGAKPETGAQPQTKAKPKAGPGAKPAAKPALPQYAPGSEGDEDEDI